MQLKDCWSDKRSELEKFVVQSKKSCIKLLRPHGLAHQVPLTMGLPRQEY